MKINLNTWFTEREIKYCPLHFVAATTPVDDDKLLWVYENLKGRFYLDNHSGFESFWNQPVIYFEDSKEAMLYELTWS